MRRFHAVLRVRAVQTPGLVPEYSLTPLWTTVAEHDGAEHSIANGEFSLAICDLGAGPASAACEVWAARRSWFPFLADIEDRRPPRKVEQGGIADEVRSRLVRIAKTLGEAAGKRGGAVELSADDIKALRGLAVAELQRIGDVVATAPGSDPDAAAAEPPDDPAPAGVPVSIVASSPLDRIAGHLRVAATEEAIQHEITRLHSALAASRAGTAEAWFSRAGDLLGLGGSPMADVVAALDRIVVSHDARTIAALGARADLLLKLLIEVQDVLGCIAEKLGCSTITTEIYDALDAVVKRAAAADDGPPPAMTDDDTADMEARLAAYSAVAAKLSSHLGASLAPEDVPIALDEVLAQVGEAEDAQGDADERTPPGFLDRLLERTSDKIAAAALRNGAP